MTITCYRIHVTDLFASISVFSSKLLLLLLFEKLFSVKRYVKVLIYFSVVLAIVAYLPNVPIGSYYCAPRVGQSWLSPNIHCDRVLPYSVVRGALNVILDLYLLYLPIPIVMGLSISGKKKIGVLSIFMVGVL